MWTAVWLSSLASRGAAAARAHNPLTAENKVQIDIVSESELIIYPETSMQRSHSSVLCGGARPMRPTPASSARTTACRAAASSQAGKSGPGPRDAASRPGRQSGAEADRPRCAVAAATLTATEQNSLLSTATGGLAALDAEWDPEAFWIQPGELGPIDRTSDPGEGPSPFRCEGCTRPECQVRGRGNSTEPETVTGRSQRARWPCFLPRAQFAPSRRLSKRCSQPPCNVLAAAAAVPPG